MKNLFIKAVIIPVLLIATNVYAQDPRLVLSFSNPLKLNPAIMQSNESSKFILSYRDQWSLIDKGYKTYSLNAMTPVYFLTLEVQDRDSLTYGTSLTALRLILLRRKIQRV